jgi:hypothetical protein
MESIQGGVRMAQKPRAVRAREPVAGDRGVDQPGVEAADRRRVEPVPAAGAARRGREGIASRTRPARQAMGDDGEVEARSARAAQ